MKNTKESNSTNESMYDHTMLSTSYTKDNRWMYKAISAYKEVDKPDEWIECPECNLKPIVWEFNNGRSTACGCGENEYNHHSIHAESVMSVVKNSDTGKSAIGYKTNDLRDNWNHWAKTKEERFVHASKRSDDRW